MAQFNNQFNGANYGQINQAGHDVNVVDQTALGALYAAGQLRAGVARLSLPGADRQRVERELDAIERQLGAAQPDRGDVAQRMKKVTDVLASAGALASAGTALLGPIGVIAGFLGPVAAEILGRGR